MGQLQSIEAQLDFLFFNDTPTTEIYTLSLHDALPITPYPYSLSRVGSNGVNPVATTTAPAAMELPSLSSTVKWGKSPCKALSTVPQRMSTRGVALRSRSKASVNSLPSSNPSSLKKGKVLESLGTLPPSAGDFSTSTDGIASELSTSATCMPATPPPMMQIGFAIRVRY